MGYEVETYKIGLNMLYIYVANVDSSQAWYILQHQMLRNFNLTSSYTLSYQK
jgi:hypothetical protein